MKKSRKGKKINTKRVIHAAFKEATKGSYTLYGCCIKEPVMKNVGIDKHHLPYFARWVAETRFNWKTWMCVFFITGDGKKRTKIEIHETPVKMNSNEASDYMSSKLIKLADSVQYKDLVSSGYVNTYNDADLSGASDDLVEMFDGYGAFDIEHCVTMHEKNKIKAALEGMAA